MYSTPNFSFQFYFHTLSKLLGEPGRFFSELPIDVGFIKPLGFLTVSSIFFTGARLICSMPINPFYPAGIFFINAVGMVFITSGLGYLVMVMIMGKSVTFKRLFCIYAFASGTTMLAAWIPFFIWLVEAWKWWLIGTGMVKAFGFKCRHVVLILGLSVCILVLLFWTALPMSMPPKG